MIVVKLGKRVCLSFFFSILLSGSGGALHAQETVVPSEDRTTDSAVVKPRMRPVDRDWSYFKAIPCDELHQIVFHSRTEEILLAKRKSQCVSQYKAFLPTPIKP
ncbi:MAG: hypothetical protein JKY66_07340 [Spongiibacteraceae bacterium]|nr:hypothetical protein [Spongiibacteraceae bacterium]